MNKCKTFFMSLIVSLVVLVNSPVFAETTPEELLQQINARKEKINQFKALLNDPDQTTRLAALDVMLKSDDPAMKEIAYGIGFSSADDAMRALALKGKFRELSVLPIKLSEPENANENEKKTLKSMAYAYQFEMKSFDDVTGIMSFKGSGYSMLGTGQVSGTGFEFDNRNCRGHFTLGDGASLEGEIMCTGGKQGVYPATARLQ